VTSLDIAWTDVDSNRDPCWRLVKSLGFDRAVGRLRRPHALLVESLLGSSILLYVFDAGSLVYQLW